MSRTITLTIDENGDQVFLKSDGAEMFRALGITVTRRASHVEPDAWVLRVLFHALRSLVSDDSAIAAWTRNWDCDWRVNTAPIGGPVLTWRDTYAPDDIQPWMEKLNYMKAQAVWRDRQSAINAEIKFVNKFFLGRTQ